MPNPLLENLFIHWGCYGGESGSMTVYDTVFTAGATFAPERIGRDDVWKKQKRHSTAAYKRTVVLSDYRLISDPSFYSQLGTEMVKTLLDNDYQVCFLTTDGQLVPVKSPEDIAKPPDNIVVGDKRHVMSQLCHYHDPKHFKLIDHSDEKKLYSSLHKISMMRLLEDPQSLGPGFRKTVNPAGGHYYTFVTTDKITRKEKLLPVHDPTICQMLDQLQTAPEDDKQYLKYLLSVYFRALHSDFFKTHMFHESQESSIEFGFRLECVKDPRALMLSLAGSQQDNVFLALHKTGQFSDILHCLPPSKHLRLILITDMSAEGEVETAGLNQAQLTKLEQLHALRVMELDSDGTINITGIFPKQLEKIIFSTYCSKDMTLDGVTNLQAVSLRFYDANKHILTEPVLKQIKSLEVEDFMISVFALQSPSLEKLSIIISRLRILNLLELKKLKTLEIKGFNVLTKIYGLEDSQIETLNLTEGATDKYIAFEDFVLPKALKHLELTYVESQNIRVIAAAVIAFFRKYPDKSLSLHVETTKSTFDGVITAANAETVMTEVVRQSYREIPKEVDALQMDTDTLVQRKMSLTSETCYYGTAYSGFLFWKSRVFTNTLSQRLNRRAIVGSMNQAQNERYLNDAQYHTRLDDALNRISRYEQITPDTVPSQHADDYYVMSVQVTAIPGQWFIIPNVYTQNAQTTATDKLIGIGDYPGLEIRFNHALQCYIGRFDNLPNKTAIAISAIYKRNVNTISVKPIPPSMPPEFAEQLDKLLQQATSDPYPESFHPSFKVFAQRLIQFKEKSSKLQGVDLERAREAFFDNVMQPYFDSFGYHEDIGKGLSQLKTYTVALTKKLGVCRHRALVGLWVANYLGIPAQVLFNGEKDASHSWLEVYNFGRFRPLEFGGGPADVTPKDVPPPGTVTEVEFVKMAARRPIALPEAVQLEEEGAHHREAASIDAEQASVFNQDHSAWAKDLGEEAFYHELMSKHHLLIDIENTQEARAIHQKMLAASGGRHLIYIERPQDFEQFYKTVVVDGKTQRILLEDGPLEQLFQEGGTILVNWSNFTPSQIASYTSLLDKKPSFNARNLSDKATIHVVGLETNTTVAGEPFYSRVNKFTWPVHIKKGQLKQVENDSEAKGDFVINLAYSDNWRGQLLGRLVSSERGYQFERGSFALRIKIPGLDTIDVLTPVEEPAREKRGGKPIKVVIQNPPDDPEFSQFCHRLLSGDALMINGKPYRLSENIELVINHTKVAPELPTVPFVHDMLQNPNAFLVNQETFNQLFYGYGVTTTGILLTDGQGWLDSAKAGSVLILADQLSLKEKLQLQHALKEQNVLRGINVRLSVLPEQLEAPAPVKGDSGGYLIESRDRNFATTRLLKEIEAGEREVTVIDISNRTTSAELLYTLKKGVNCFLLANKPDAHQLQGLRENEVLVWPKAQGIYEFYGKVGGGVIHSEITLDTMPQLNFRLNQLTRSLDGQETRRLSGDVDRWFNDALFNCLNKGRGVNLYFSPQYKQVFEKLVAGEDVILNGPMSQALYQELESFFSDTPYLIVGGKRVDVEQTKHKRFGRLYVVSDPLSYNPALAKYSRRHIQPLVSKARFDAYRKMYLEQHAVPTELMDDFEKHFGHILQYYQSLESMPFGGKGVPKSLRFSYSQVENMLDHLMAISLGTLRPAFDMERQNPIKQFMQFDYTKNTEHYAYSNVLAKIIFSNARNEGKAQQQPIDLVKSKTLLKPPPSPWQVLNTCSGAYLLAVLVGEYNKAHDVKLPVLKTADAYAVQDLKKLVDFLGPMGRINPAVFEAIKAKVESSVLVPPAKKKISRKDKTIARFEHAIDTNQVVVAKGPPGSGKTFTAEHYIAKVKGDSYWGKDNIVAWLQSKPVGGSFLLLDEANMEEEGVWDFLNALLRKTPASGGGYIINYQGETYHITDGHKVIATCNPESYQGRYYHKVLQDVPTVYFQQWTNSDMLAMFSEIAGARYKKWHVSSLLDASASVRELIKPQTLSLRDIGQILQRAEYLQDQAVHNKQGVPELRLLLFHACMQQWSSMVIGEKSHEYREALFDLLNHQFVPALSGRDIADLELYNRNLMEYKAGFQKFIFDEELKRDKAGLKPDGFFLPESSKDFDRYNMLFALDQDLQMMDWRTKHMPPGEFVGQAGLLLEGSPGTGKSTLVDKALQFRDYQLIEDPENLLAIDPDKPQPPQKRYVRFTLGGDNNEELLLQAFRLGYTVIIDEINLIDDPAFEQLLNHLMTGKTPQGESAKHPGFFVIGTQNDASVAGRYKLSNAFLNRFHQIKYPDYQESELREIAEKRFAQAGIKDINIDKLVRDYLEKRKVDSNCNARVFFRAITDMIESRAEPALKAAGPHAKK